ncbi:MAG: kelch repeat-containing protein [Promethearchaeota archaeon]
MQNRKQIRKVFMGLGFTILFAFMMLTPPNVLAIPIGEWTNMEPTTAPIPRMHSPLAYNVNAGRVMLYGGFNATFDHLGDTWAYRYSTNTWTNRAPSTSPPATGGHCLSYDLDSRQIILFGGHLSGSSSTIVSYYETWAYDYDTNTWTNRTTTTHPPGTAWGDMAYAIQAERQILFGGLGDSATYLGDTWAYDYDTNTWTDRAPAASPPRRFDHRMVYDSESDKVILVGGIGLGAAILDDVWAYDYDTNTWTERTSFPTIIASHSLAYDSAMDRVILYGGARNFGETDLRDETWTYDYNTDTWELLITDPHPPEACRGYMTYDAGAERTILFGFRGPQPDPVLYEETWALHYLDITIPPPPFPGFPTAAIVLGIALTLGIVILIRRKRN